MLVHKTKSSGLHVGAAMDHLVECTASVRTESRTFEDGGLVTVATALRPGQKLRMIKFVSYGWSGERSLPAVRDQVQAALSAARQTGWEGLLAEQRAFLDDLLGPRRCRGRRGPRGAAGGALRPVPRAAGRGQGGEPGDPRQGANRARLRRAHILGHRDLRAAHAELHRTHRGRERAAVAAQHAPACRRPGRPAGPARRGLPVADDHRPRMLGLLARRHRRVPRERRHRHRGRPPRRRHGG